MGGSIEVSSVYGEGSTFNFTVSALCNSNEPAPDEETFVRPSLPRLPLIDIVPDIQSHHGRILLAEDNRVNSKVALLMLQRLGIKADHVVNGQEEVQAYRKNKYDLILMDLQMPILDGLEATKKIRDLTKERENPWIIALTAGAMQQNRDQAFAAGFNDFVTKPIHFNLLKDTVLSRLESSNRRDLSLRRADA